MPEANPTIANASASDGLALLVLDVQPPFLKAVAKTAELTKRVAFAIEAARLLGIDTVFTEQVPEKLGNSDESLLACASRRVVLAKTAFSALQAPGMEAFIRDHGVRHLIVCGIETSICVYQTVIEALQQGLGVTVLTDAVSARRKADHKAVLSFLNNRTQATVLPAETVFYTLLGGASHPAFREYTQLVKKYGD